MTPLWARSPAAGLSPETGFTGGHDIGLFEQLGDDCTIYQHVTLSPATLGAAVCIEAGAIITGRVAIGDGARIGPKAGVTMDLPAGDGAVPRRRRFAPVRSNRAWP